jgi:hypothetical protein
MRRLVEQSCCENTGCCQCADATNIKYTKAVSAWARCADRRGRGDSVGYASCSTVYPALGDSYACGGLVDKASIPILKVSSARGDERRSRFIQDGGTMTIEEGVSLVEAREVEEVAPGEGRMGIDCDTDIA